MPSYITQPDGTVIVEKEALPPPPRIITPRAFMDRLSRETQLRIITARKTNAEVDLLVLRLTAGDVDLDYPETIAGVAAMQAAKLITADEAAALLA